MYLDHSKILFEPLKSHLKLVRYKQSTWNPYSFMWYYCIYVYYVDVILIVAKSDKINDETIKGLRNIAPQLVTDEEVAGFLGVGI